MDAAELIQRAEDSDLAIVLSPEGRVFVWATVAYCMQGSPGLRLLLAIHEQELAAELRRNVSPQHEPEVAVANARAAVAKWFVTDLTPYIKRQAEGH